MIEIFASKWNKLRAHFAVTTVLSSQMIWRICFLFRRRKKFQIQSIISCSPSLRRFNECNYYRPDNIKQTFTLFFSYDSPNKFMIHMCPRLLRCQTTLLQILLLSNEKLLKFKGKIETNSLNVTHLVRPSLLQWWKFAWDQFINCTNGRIGFLKHSLEPPFCLTNRRHRCNEKMLFITS